VVINSQVLIIFDICMCENNDWADVGVGLIDVIMQFLKMFRSFSLSVHCVFFVFEVPLSISRFLFYFIFI